MSNEQFAEKQYAKKQYALVCACYDRDEGLYLYGLSDRTLTAAGKIKSSSPNYVCIDGDMIYAAVGRSADGKTPAGVARYKITDGKLVPDGKVVAVGGICHVSAVGDRIFTADYDRGIAVMIPKSAFDGGAEIKKVSHIGQGVNPDRQSSPHVHQMTPTPDGRFVCACDLGLDAIFVYDYDLCEVSRCYLPDGRGPRHLIFSPDGHFIYCLTEMGNTVECLTYSYGHLTRVGSVSTLPASFTAHSQAAAIRMSADGHHLYASNRGHNSIAHIIVNGADMRVDSIYTCGGDWPRDINLTPDGHALFCCNEYTGSVTGFNISEDGSLTETGITAENVPGAMNIEFFQM